MKSTDPVIVNEWLKHIVFIMDGNGRWAKERGLSRSAGHKKGVDRVDEIVEECFFHYGISVVSLYVFSTENWKREQKEIATLFRLLKIFFKRFIKKFKDRGIRLVVSGDLTDSRIPLDVLKTIEEAIDQTKDNKSYYFNVLFNYGGRGELVHAVKSLLKSAEDNSKMDISLIDEVSIGSNLYHPELPDVDLLVRTSGEIRLSNCLLFQIAYAEMIFNPIYWPDYSKEALNEDLKTYLKRKRRYGGVENESSI